MSAVKRASKAKAKKAKAKKAKAKKATRAATPRAQLDAFIDKYSADVAKQGRTAFAKMRKLLPAATVLVYDNYNALAIGFGPGEQSSKIVFSIALYPRWVSLFFAKGVGLPDPHRLLKGSGSTVRHIVVETPDALDDPRVRELMRHALHRAGTSLDDGPAGSIIIKSVSARQRPRRPAAVNSRARLG
jgi:hypothetical protein